MCTPGLLSDKLLLDAEPGLNVQVVIVSVNATEFTIFSISASVVISLCAVRMSAQENVVQ